MNPFSEYPHPVKHGSQGNCGSGYVMVLVSQVILQKRVIKETCDLMKGTPSWFSGYRYCNSGDIMVLVCLIILQDHVTKGSSNMSRTTLRSVNNRFNLSHD